MAVPVAPLGQQPAVQDADGHGDEQQAVGQTGRRGHGAADVAVAPRRAAVGVAQQLSQHQRVANLVDGRRGQPVDVTRPLAVAQRQRRRRHVGARAEQDAGGVPRHPHASGRLRAGSRSRLVHQWAALVVLQFFYC